MTTKKTRIKHAPEFKAEALKLAEKVGVAAAARQLSLYEFQIYGWRKDAKINDRERELTTENAKLVMVHLIRQRQRVAVQIVLT